LKSGNSVDSPGSRIPASARHGRALLGKPLLLALGFPDTLAASDSALDGGKQTE
jgi:hypothetical protein